MTTRGDAQGYAFTGLLESVVELIREACLVMSPDGRILLANEAAERLYGYGSERLASMHVSELYTPENLALLPEELMHAGDGGLLFDSVHVRADGSTVAVRVSWKRSEFCEREVLLATVIENGEHPVLEQERFKSAAFDAALDPIIVHDRHGNVLHFNRAAAVASGMTADEFATIEPWGWIAEAHHELVGQRLETLSSAGSLIFETMSRRADATLYPSEVHARLLDHTNGLVIVSVVRDVTERKRAEATVQQMAYHDVLTGLPNRLLLTERAEQAMADVHRHGDLLGMAFIDLDHFKPVNDSIGHQGGDVVLSTIASRLLTAVRSGDTVARLGGDEFVILLPRLVDADALEGLGEKLCRVVSEPVTVGDMRISIHASVGLAVFDPETDGLSTLLSKADLAMYSAKRSGERWAVFDDSVLRR